MAKWNCRNCQRLTLFENRFSANCFYNQKAEHPNLPFVTSQSSRPTRCDLVSDSSQWRGSRCLPAGAPRLCRACASGRVLVKPVGPEARRPGGLRVITSPPQLREPAASQEKSRLARSRQLGCETRGEKVIKLLCRVLTHEHFWACPEGAPTPPLQQETIGACDFRHVKRA